MLGMERSLDWINQRSNVVGLRSGLKTLPTIGRPRGPGGILL